MHSASGLHSPLPIPSNPAFTLSLSALKLLTVSTCLRNVEELTNETRACTTGLAGFSMCGGGKLIHNHHGYPTHTTLPVDHHAPHILRLVLQPCILRIIHAQVCKTPLCIRRAALKNRTPHPHRSPPLSLSLLLPPTPLVSHQQHPPPVRPLQHRRADHGPRLRGERRLLRGSGPVPVRVGWRALQERRVWQERPCGRQVEHMPAGGELPRLDP